jgi:hypothetical protein
MKAALFVVIALAAMLPALAKPTDATSARHTIACQEGDPCWSWSQMGNRKRGVVDLRTGLRVVVGPCAFRRLWMNGDANLVPNARLKGDWYAIKHGCE